MPVSTTNQRASSAATKKIRATIHRAFERESAHGKIDDAGIERIIEGVRRGRLTQSKASELLHEEAAFHDRMTPKAQRAFHHFVTGTMKGIEILDKSDRKRTPGEPAVIGADRERLVDEAVPGGVLFKHGVKGSDPEQNYIGDCYLMAAMSAVAKMKPEVIEKAFRRNKDGTYTVRLWDRRGKLFKARDVVIDDKLPRDGWYGYYYARSKDPKELWPALLEKAFAVRAGSYHLIEAGVPGDAMAAITGKPSIDINLRGRGVDADAVFAQMSAAAKAGKPMTAATLSDSSAAKYKGTNIYTDHTYTVWGTSTESGVKYVHLRNPWGDSEPKGNGRDDGIFKLPLATFMSLYSDVAING